MKTAYLKESWSQLRSDLENKSTMRLAAALPAFFRKRITVEDARREIKRALDNRNDLFLDIVRTRIYECPESPYLKLLRFAGCQLPDLRTSVRAHGVERTLEALARQGVYLTSEEFKGKREVVRGSLHFAVSPDDFAGPASSRAGYSIESSGTRNKPLRTATTLKWLTLRAFGTAIFYSAHDLFSHSVALYDGILPANSISHLLLNAKLGIRSDRWFARAIPVNNAAEALYHRSLTGLMVVMGKCFGPGFPAPEPTGAEDIARIVRWVEAHNTLGKRCHIITIPSNAVRIARVACDLGASLEGTVFNLGAEPFTKAKEEAVARVGARTTSRYAYGGSNLVGYGCADPVYRDEVHVNQQMLAVIASPRVVCGNDEKPIHPILMTTLHSAAPRLLFNIENGDYVTFQHRECGCALQQAGLTLHLHHIRSFDKFTSEGMNYFYGDLFELFENTLPREFGGGPGDYQLVEEEDSTGQTRLTLIVHPEVGQLDESTVLARLRNALANGSRTNRFMARVWENAGTFRVKRELPYASPRGKILPLHIPRAKTNDLRVTIRG